MKELNVLKKDNKTKSGFTIFITGLSGAGKSTTARALYAALSATEERPVVLLDGDAVRKHLSPDLGFSREDREANLKRAGLMAKEITEKGGIAICAFIAPYERSRRANRELISQHGGYIEVYLSTPLEVCEKRDPNGLYAKARQGLIKYFTGIDDPYEAPKNPEITIDTSDLTPDQVVTRILTYLRKQGYVKVNGG
jgi:sulfate adenylyltransferase